MKKRPQILCPVDFSPGSDNAVKVAAHIASGTGASIRLLHVFNSPVITTDIHVDYTERMAEYEAVLLANMQSLSGLIGEVDISIPCDYVIEEGSAAFHICRMVNEQKTDLLVMGTQSASAFEYFVFGSETFNILSQITCPLLIVPENYTFRRPERIVYASDFMERDTEAISWMVEFARSFNPELIVLNVTSKGAQDHHFYRMFKAHLRKRIDYPAITVHQTLNDNVREGLETYVKSNDADWVALMSREREGDHKLFDKSLCREVAQHSLIPVLIFHMPETYKDIYGDWILKELSV